MYETGGIKCPVISFEKYMSKRNKKSCALFQYPKSAFTDDEEEWYENRAMGKNAIGNFMSVLSKKANLSEEYTNHCIRATTITELDRYGFKDRDIISVSGHRNTAALKRYNLFMINFFYKNNPHVVREHYRLCGTKCPVFDFVCHDRVFY